MTGSSDSMELFVACAPGIEPLLEEELRELEVGGRAVAGGVELTASRSQAIRIALGCSLGARLLMRVGRFPARHFSQLERGCGRIDWGALLPESAALDLKVTARRSRLYHTAAIAERVRRAAGRGAPGPDAGDAPVLLHVRLAEDECTLSLDLAGAPLHQRGYRLAVGKAPLREDLASALLRVAGFEAGRALLDPMCGSGTIPIEAARRAAGIAPGAVHAAALARLPRFDPDEIARQEAALAREPVASAIHGSDRDAGAVRSAVQNAERAGVTDLLRLEKAPLSRAPLPQGDSTLLVTNPPHGRRIRSKGGLRDLHAALGNLRRANEGMRLALLTPDPALARATGVKLESAFLTDLGGVKVRAYVEV